MAKATPAPSAIPDLFHQVRGERFEGGEEGQGQASRSATDGPPWACPGRAVRAVPGGQGAQPRFGPSTRRRASG